MMPRFAALLAAVLLLSWVASAGETTYLVRDLPGTTSASSMGYDGWIWTTVGDWTWFKAARASGEVGLFRTNGTTTFEVTSAVGRPHPQHTRPYLGTVNGKVIYVGVDGVHEGVYAIDGNGDGDPQLLTRMNVSALTNAVLLDGFLYFSGAQRELWKTDGTPDGTQLIEVMPGKDLAFTAQDTQVYAAGGVLFFFGNAPEGSGFHSTNLISSTLLLPLTSSELHNYTRQVVAVGDRLVFSISFGPQRGLWTTDGTREGTQRLNDVPDFEPLATLDGRLFFMGSIKSIWVTDGTPSGTNETDIDDALGTSRVLNAQPMGDRLMFITSSYPERYALWSTRGSAATTHAIMDIERNSNFSSAAEGFVVNDRYYFAHDNGVHGRELWSTDGENAQLVKDINPDRRDGLTFAAFGHVRPDGHVIFGARRYDTGTEPWVTDGTAAGTHLIANIAQDIPVESSQPKLLRASGDRVFFSATVDDEQMIVVSDGSSSGTDVIGYGVANTIYPPVTWRGRYFFSSDALYVATTPGVAPEMIYNAQTTPYPVANGVVFESKRSNTLSRSDGTGAGTMPILQLSGLGEARIFPTGDIAWVTDRSNRLWKTDGTVAGSMEIPLEPGLTSAVLDIIAVGDAYFVLESSGTLWKTDGTSAGMQIVARLPIPPSYLVGWGKFLAADARFAYLWFGGVSYRTDGTEAGTFALPLPISKCASAAFVRDTLVVLTTNYLNRLTLTRSDGTVSGTSSMMEVANAPSSFCLPIVSNGTSAYFAFLDSGHGWEPWTTDGTMSGTTVVADVNPIGSSYPEEFTVAGDRVFFSAFTPEAGRELWAIGDVPTTRRRGVRH